MEVTFEKEASHAATGEIQNQFGGCAACELQDLVYSTASMDNEEHYVSL
jgi:hypothetical protein